jgi:hypothetical protein
VQLGMNEPFGVGWVIDDYLETLRRLPRSGLREEPPRLSQGRRARIEALKAAGQGA